MLYFYILLFLIFEFMLIRAGFFFFQVTNSNVTKKCSSVNGDAVLQYFRIITIVSRYQEIVQYIDVP
jgi:hypothetical protein